MFIKSMTFIRKLNRKNVYFSNFSNLVAESYEKIQNFSISISKIMLGRPKKKTTGMYVVNTMVIKL